MRRLPHQPAVPELQPECCRGHCRAFRAGATKRASVSQDFAYRNGFAIDFVTTTNLFRLSTFTLFLVYLAGELFEMFLVTHIDPFNGMLE